MVAENSVMLFTKSFCRYSKKTKEFFQSKNVHFEYLDLVRPKIAIEMNLVLQNKSPKAKTII
jgi:glutaredoxin